MSVKVTLHDEIKTQEFPKLISDVPESTFCPEKKFIVRYYDVNQYSQHKLFDYFKDASDFITGFDRIMKAPAPTPVNDFETITASIAKVLTEKNKRYGNSALNPLSVFNGKSKVGQRADDKLSRIQNSPELRKNDLCDLIGYCILMCKENGWYDFSDQID